MNHSSENLDSYAENQVRSDEEDESMNRAEWLEIVDWIRDRFNRPWTQKQAEAFYYDLRGFTIGSVKEAVHHLYSKGLTRPPTGSEILSYVLEVGRADEQAKIPMDECKHLPVDDEGYCTACGGIPKLGKLLDELEEIKLNEISAITAKDRSMLTTVIGNPPEDTRVY